MPKIIIQAFITLDGVMQSPGGPYEDPSDGFRYGGWAVNFFDEAMLRFVGEATNKPFALLLGRSFTPNVKVAQEPTKYYTYPLLKVGFYCRSGFPPAINAHATPND
jgi:hypothetical protein